MTLTFDDGTTVVYIGDVRACLTELPGESVDCVVTSPPYWGLRDYGTAKWEGGDAGCDHRSPTMRDGRNEARPTLAGSVATNQAQMLLAARSACGRCGAMRVDAQMGLEPTAQEYIAAMVGVFGDVRRVLKGTGTLWLNMGDCYASGVNGTKHGDKGYSLAGHGADDRTFRDKPFATIGNGLKPKDKVLMPHRLAIALCDAGWYVRQDNVWSKPNPMPESVRDRPTNAHEYVFLMSKSERYWYDADAVREPAQSDHPSGNGYARSARLTYRDAAGARGSADPWDGVGGTRNARSVWTVPTSPYSGAHFATFPEEIPRRCIAAGCPPDGVVLDPFAGSGTTLAVARRMGRRSIGIDLNPDNPPLIRERARLDEPMLPLVDEA